MNAFVKSHAWVANQNPHFNGKVPSFEFTLCLYGFNKVSKYLLLFYLWSLGTFLSRPPHSCAEISCDFTPLISRYVGKKLSDQPIRDVGRPPYLSREREKLLKTKATELAMEKDWFTPATFERKVMELKAVELDPVHTISSATAPPSHRTFTRL